LVINQTIAESLKTLLPKYQILHVSGERDYDWLGFQASKLPEELASNYHLRNFLSGDLKDAYAVADLVISRAGNNVIAELAALSKPTILIPIEASANGHQVSNAKILSRMGAAILVLEENLSPRVLERKIGYLFENPEEMKGLADKISKLSSPEAAGAVADIIFEQAKNFIDETDAEEGSVESKPSE
jgi:UDP-N-acetylglucosamine--N-acetylmuramyl-(pentapeptide) pyrophosphoryl-undecaprenol N-acetylglucosamine transferase